jgi:NADP-dependent 3-hydroxy acid dehydrogenase YdfG
MPSLKQARAANEAFNPPYRPIAMFVGGTSGIGQATAERFAHHTKGKFN